jgi:hypothetical protein
MTDLFMPGDLSFLGLNYPNSPCAVKQPPAERPRGAKTLPELWGKEGFDAADVEPFEIADDEVGPA